MTSKERVIAALEGKEPDRIPWGEHFIDYNVYEAILGRPSLTHAKFKEMKAYWEGRRDEVVESQKRDMVDLTLALDMDIVMVNFVPPKDYKPEPLRKVDDEHYVDTQGNRYIYSHQTEDLMKTPINTAFFQREITLEEVQQMIDDLKKQPPVDYNDSTFEVINHVVSKLGKTHFLIANVNGLEWPRFGETDEDSWINLMTEPEICEKIAELQAKQTIRMLPALKQAGVDGILSVGDLGNTTNLFASPQIYDRILYRWHKEIYREAKNLGLYVMRHCCGHIWPIIDRIAETNDSYEAIQEMAGMDIVRLKREVGDRLTLWGGILHEHIHGGTPEDIRKDAKRSFSNCAKGGRFIMGSSHSLAIGARMENILEMKRCRDEWGVYPIRIPQGM